MSDLVNSILGFVLHFFYLLVFAITFPLRSLSDVSLNSNIASSLTTASGYLHSINAILPVDTMLTILGISLSFESGYLFYKIIMWVIKKIPTIN